MQDKRQGTANPGLTRKEAQARLAQYGPNMLGEAARTSWAVILLRQFTGLLVLILIGAAIVAAVLGEAIDALAIGLVVVLNGALGFVQEWQAETARVALRSMLSPKARVRRDGVAQEIDSAGLVPGDLVLLSAGDKVPADLVLHRGVNLRVDESTLTGESLPVSKAVSKAGSKAAADEDAARLFMGTAIATGHGEGEVLATGRATAFGQIATLTTSVGEKTTHLQRVLARLARQMAAIALGVAALVAAAGLWAGHGLREMFFMALSLAVAIVPEGLPAVVTITLALGAAAMVRQQALARRLQAVETLGAASVICTDKTGTLTEDKMTATRLWTPSGIYEVSGGGYDPAGHITNAAGRPLRAGDDPVLGEALETAWRCNRAALSQEGGAWHMIGTPTEGALVTLAYKGWCQPTAPDARGIGELPFSSERKRMAVLAAGEGGFVLHVKGAPEAILARCTRYRIQSDARPLGPEARARFETAYEEMAGKGMRVIALARCRQRGPDLPADEQDLTFLGFIGLMDPPRAEVRSAIAAARSAGIRVIMITGDGAPTAGAVAQMVGLGAPLVLSGADIEALSEDELDAALEGEVLFARTAPGHKMRLVRRLQAKGQIVAMTGDGVNDAPALKQSDIGVAMGQRGTDVARDAADLVLFDDNFATIVRAIREGRRQFENLLKRN